MASEGASPRMVDPLPGCGAFALELGLFVDGELSDVERTAVETHLDGCEACRTHVDGELALRSAVRRSSPAIAAPAGLRGKVLAALDSEDALAATHAAPVTDGPPVPTPVRRAKAFFRRRLGVAAVGATALSLGAFIYAGTPRNDDVLHDIVARHSRRQPLEFQGDDPRSLEQWLQDKVDFRVRVPRIQGAPLSLVGARLSHVKDHQAVYVLFGTPQSPSRHVSLVVFDDPEKAPPVKGIPHKVDDRDVYTANAQGYNVALWKQNEVVYSLVSDGDDDLDSLVRAAGGP